MCVEQLCIDPLTSFCALLYPTLLIFLLFCHWFVSESALFSAMSDLFLSFSFFFCFLFRLINFYVVARVAKIYYHAICTIIYISRVRIHHFFILTFDKVKVDFDQENKYAAIYIHTGSYCCISTLLVKY